MNLIKENNMTNVKGYFVTSAERDLFLINDRKIKRDDPESNEFKFFIQNFLKIGAFFALYHGIDEMDFNKKQKELFTESAALFFTQDDQQILELKDYAKQALINQTIVAIVSNWESYFSGIIKTIFNDTNYLEYSYQPEHKSKFQKILAKIKIEKEFNEKFLKEGNSFDNFQFGTFIIKQRRINFQDVDKIVKIMDCFDINIIDLSKKIKPDFWEEINKHVITRQIIVHEQDHTVDGRSHFRNIKAKKNDKISDVYTMENLLEFSITMHKIINRVDLVLFSEYEI